MAALVSLSLKLDGPCDYIQRKNLVILVIFNRENQCIEVGYSLEVLHHRISRSSSFLFKPPHCYDLASYDYSVILSVLYKTPTFNNLTTQVRPGHIQKGCTNPQTDGMLFTNNKN